MGDIYLKPVDSREVSQRIREELLDWIQESAKGNDVFKLPNEEELAKMLNVSRTGLRDALTVMEGEGYITRRRGIGTLVNPVIARCRTRLDLRTELSDLIAAQGYEPSFKLCNMEFVEESRENFRPNETGYLKVEKVFYADGIHVAYCVDRLAGSIAIKTKEHFQELEYKNLYDFIEKYIGVQCAYVLSNVRAERPIPYQAEIMEIKPDMPVLYLDNVTFDHDHMPYMYSSVLLRTDILKMQLLRKTI